jgi:hypothetical protein
MVQPVTIRDTLLPGAVAVAEPVADHRKRADGNRRILDHVVRRAERERALPARLVRSARDHHHGLLPIVHDAALVEEPKAVEDRHLQIEQDQIGPVLA